MKHHLNTLFVTTQGAYLRKEGEAVAVRIDKQTRLRVPLHHLGGIVCFGRIGVSPQLMGRCAEGGVAISFLTEYGRLLGRVVGFTAGNVLLRREQYRRADAMGSASGSGNGDGNGQAGDCAAIVQPIVLGKLLNSRAVLLRGVRDHADGPGSEALSRAAQGLAGSVQQAQVTMACLRTMYQPQ